MKKRLTAFVFSAALSVLSLCADAAFSKTNTYPENKFADVDSSAWYASEIAGAYELGFMNGKSETVMAPDGTVNVAEAVTIAARLNAAYENRTDELQNGAKSESWYDIYAGYAEKYGIINKENIDSFARPARRYELCEMFAAALPKSWYTRKNNVSEIPDVSEADSYYNDLVMLYNAGVVMGSDEYGTFYPNNSIKRSETAAIVNRAALPENRLSKTLKAYPVDKNMQAVYLIDDAGLSRTDKNGITEFIHGWILDNRSPDASFSRNGTVSPMLSDKDANAHVSLSKYITEVPKENLVLMTTVSLDGASDGFEICFSDYDTEKIKIFTRNGFFGFNGDKEYMSEISASKGTYNIRFDFDLAKKTAVLSVNGKKACEGALNDVGKLNKIAFSTTDAAYGISVLISSVRLYMNYNLNERFSFDAVSEQPAGWTNTGDVKVEVNKSGSYDDINSVKINQNGSSEKHFEALGGAFVVQSYILKENDGGQAKVEILSGDKAVSTLVMKDGKFIKDGKELRAYHNDVWTCVRFERDKNGNTVLRINGKDADKFTLAGSVDGIRISASDTVLWFDDVTAYNTYEFADYPSKPVQNNLKDDYTAIMSVCSLWHEGTHYGWDYVVPYDELIPKMGFYDEGLPETADWEIKHMVEHGIDAIQPCWYASTTDTPMKTPRLNQFAIHDGYFNAKYRDMMDICIMWENQSFTANTDLENFKRVLWNYWVDWYFTDPNYLCFDNKPVLTIYRYNTFVSSLGGAENAKAAIDFMNEDIKKYGYDGIILLFNIYTAAEANTVDASAKKDGIVFDGFLPYHWGVNAYDYNYVKQQYSTGYTGKGDNMIVACGSTGRNILGWEQTRTPIATFDNYKKQLEYLRDDVLKTYEKDFGTGSWQSKTVFFGTWNEYAEGHWLAPTGRNGSGPQYNYSDAEALVFSGVQPYEYDAELTANQKARIGYMYTGKTSPIRALHLEEENASLEEEEKETVVKSLDFSNEDAVSQFNQVTRINALEVKDGYIHGAAEEGQVEKPDPILGIGTVSGLDASEITRIHIRIRSSVVTNSEIYYMTGTDASYNAKKSISQSIKTAGEWTDLYFDMTKAEGWSGKILKIRFDPINAYGEFDISAIEFLKAEDSGNSRFKITADGVMLDINDKYIEKTDTEVYLAALPTEGFYSMAAFSYEWRRLDGRLIVKAGTGAKTTEFVFDIGSSICKVNGKDHSLARKFYLYDGIPVLPVKFMLDLSGIKYTESASELKINIRDKDYSQVISDRRDHCYDFNIPGDSENWSISKASGYVSDGKLYMAAEEQMSGSKFDPILSIKKMKPAIMNAKLYSVIKVRMKYTLNGKTDDTAVVYFTTDNLSSYAEKGSARVKLSEAPVDSEGYSILTFNMAENENWTGTVTSLRFDPFNSDGSCEIDCIYCLDKDGNFVTGTAGGKEQQGAAASEESAKDGIEIINGDAEDTVNVSAFYSIYGEQNKISIVTDPTNPNNHVYRVEPAKDGKVYVSLAQSVTFTEGKSYQLDYDVYVVSDYDGNAVTKVQMWENLIYNSLGQEKKNHTVNAGFAESGKWMHMSAVKKLDEGNGDRSGDTIMLFATPQNDKGMIILIDNIVLKEAES